MPDSCMIPVAFFLFGFYIHKTKLQNAVEKKKNSKVLEAMTYLISARSDEATSAKQLFDVASKTVTSLLNCEKTSIYLCDNTLSEVFLVSKVQDNLEEGLTLSFGQGIAGKCAQTCKLQRFDSALNQMSHFKEIDKLTGFQTKSMLCAPVCEVDSSKELKSLAVIQVINKQGGGSFTKDDEDCLNYIIKELLLGLRTKARDYYELKHFGKRHSIDATLEAALLMQYGIDKIEERKYRVVNSMKVLSQAIIASQRLINVTKESENNSPEFDADILNYNYNPFNASDEHLINLAMQMIVHYDLVSELNLQFNLLKKFIIKVSTMYNKPKFHNFKHGWGVMHLTFMILKAGGDKYLSSLELFAMLISAICHDIGHPGVNNGFEIATRSERAILYSDDSVLERFHSATTIRLLSLPEFDIVSNFSPEDKVYFRKIITSNIIATDMFHHFACVDKLNSIKNTFDVSNLAIRKFLMGSIVHSADIGAQTQSLDVSLLWTECIVGEFGDQVQEEVKRGLLPTPFMDGLDNEVKKFKLQADFVNDIVIPLWEALSDIIPELKLRVQQAKATRDMFISKSTPPAAKSLISSSI